MELRPPVHASSVLIHMGGWSNKKHFEKYYEDKTPYPVLHVQKGREAVLYLNVERERNLGEEAFRRFWKNPSFLSERTKLIVNYKSRVNEIRSLVDELRRSFPKSTSKKSLKKPSKAAILRTIVQPHEKELKQIETELADVEAKLGNL